MPAYFPGQIQSTTKAGFIQYWFVIDHFAAVRCDQAVIRQARYGRRRNVVKRASYQVRLHLRSEISARLASLGLIAGPDQHAVECFLNATLQLWIFAYWWWIQNFLGVGLQVFIWIQFAGT